MTSLQWEEVQFPARSSVIDGSLKHDSSFGRGGLKVGDVAARDHAVAGVMSFKYKTANSGSKSRDPNLASSPWDKSLKVAALIPLMA